MNENKNKSEKKENNIVNDSTKTKDLTKALTFLLSKESKDISLDEKKAFLLTKLPEATVNQAIEIYPMIKTISFEQINEQSSNNSIFSSLFDVGIISSAVLTSLLVNYLFDLNREKKNEVFALEIEKKLLEEQKKNNDEIKEEISKKMENFVEKQNLSSEINNELNIFSQGKGLTINPSLSKIKNEIATMQNDIVSLNTKVDNNMFVISQNLKNELKTLLNEYFSKNQSNIINNNNNISNNQPIFGP